MSAKLSSMLAPALEYAERKFYVFPCWPRTKKPIPKNGFKAATIDVAKIETWWTENPDANLAIACAMSSIVVLDIDVPSAAHPELKVSGEDTLAAHAEKLGRLPETVTAQTGAGGRHLFFLAPAGAKFKAALGPGVEIKSAGYVMVDPSVHPDTGKQWRWIISLLTRMPAPLPPAWLAHMLKPAAPKMATTTTRTGARTMSGCTPYGAKSKADEIQKVRTTPIGARNKELFKSSAALSELHAGGEIDDCRDELVAAVVAPDFTEHEARTTVESGWRAGLAHPRTAPARNHAPQASPAPVIDLASAEAWGEPEPLDDVMPPIPQFIAELLPESLRDWVMDIAERLQCPVEYVAVTVLSALGSVIGRQCAIRPKQHDDWVVVVNLWCVIVGPPSAMKSPARAEALRPLRRLAIEAAGDYAKAMENHEAVKALAKARRAAVESKMLKAAKTGKGDDAVLIDEFSAATEPAKIVQRRYSTSDSTPEKLGELLIENPNGLMVECDELSGFLRLLDRDGHEGARAFYLTSHDGTHGYIQDRIARGTTWIPALCVTICGGIQPGVLAQYLTAAIRGGAGDDGFVQRFGLAVYPDLCRDYRHVDRWPNKEARERAFHVFKRLANLSPSMVGATVEDQELPFLRFDAAAQVFFAGWLSDLMHRLRAGEDHAAVEAHLMKYTKLMPALALIFHLADGCQGAVSLTSARRAAALCALLEDHARRIYSSITAEKFRAAKVLLGKLRSGKLASPFTAREIYRSGWAGLTEREVVEEALTVLVDHGWLRDITPDQPGRPRREYHAHLFCRFCQCLNLGMPNFLTPYAQHRKKVCNELSYILPRADKEV